MKERIEKVLSNLDSTGDIRQAQAAERRERLKKMVDEHGYDNTALAAGLSVNTLALYLRSKYPPVSERAVAQAEYVFRNI